MKRKIHWSGTQRLKKQERVISGLGQDSTGDYLSNLRLNAIAILRESDQRNSTNAMDDSIKPLFPSTGKANFFFFSQIAWGQVSSGRNGTNTEKKYFSSPLREKYYVAYLQHPVR